MTLLTIMISLALLATLAVLGLGLLSMAIGGSTDKEFCEKFMWARVGLQGTALVLIVIALYLSTYE